MYLVQREEEQGGHDLWLCVIASKLYSHIRARVLYTVYVYQTAGLLLRHVLGRVQLHTA